MDPKTSKISLADCLACNGCITAAETILIEEHSISKFLEKSKGKILVLGVSKQSIASFSSFTGKCPDDVVRGINNALKPTLMVDMEEFVDYALRLSYTEFKTWKDDKKKMLLCSECPGWVCYSEKKIGDWILPNVSRVKSPQQIMGIIIRRILTKICKVDNDDICIATIMPCFDKKIESVRNYNEIDCVLSTIEVEDYMTHNKETITFQSHPFTYYSFNGFSEIVMEWLHMNDTSMSFIDFLMKKNDTVSESCFDYSLMFSYENYSSNGYAEYIIHQLQLEYPKSSIEFTKGRNIDINEIKLIDLETKSPIAVFCLAYGFRNIQNIIRNFKKNTYDYIEIMACPGGCLNGGGQIRQIEKQPKFLMTEIDQQKQKHSHQKTLSPSFQDTLSMLKISFNLNDFSQTYKSIDSSLSDLKW